MAATVNPNANLSMSDAGIEALMKHEKFVPKAYPDGAGVWTVGYGTTKINGVPVTPGTVVTMSQAKEYLHSDLAHFEESVRSKITQPLTQNQFDSLTSFVYNTGPGGLNGDVSKYANSGDMSKVPGAMLQYIGISPTYKVGDNQIKITVPDAGLASRRIDEAYQFDPSASTKGDLYNIAFANAEKMRTEGKTAEKLATLDGWRAEDAARKDRLINEQYFPGQQTTTPPNMSKVENLPGYENELRNAVQQDQNQFEKSWQKLANKYDETVTFKAPNLGDVEQRLHNQGNWPLGNTDPGPQYCPVPDTNAPLFTPATPVPPSPGNIPPTGLTPLGSNLTTPASSDNQPVLLAANQPLSGFSADGMSYSDQNAAVASSILGRSLPAGDGPQPLSGILPSDAPVSSPPELVPVSYIPGPLATTASAQQPGATLFNAYDVSLSNATAQSTPATLLPVSGIQGNAVIQSTSLRGPEFSSSNLSCVDPVDPNNPLGITDTEGKSIAQRLGLGEGQYIGSPDRNADGSWFYPIYNKEGNIPAGGIDMRRNADGSLTATDAFKHNSLQFEYGWDRPNAKAGFADGKNTTTDFNASHDDEQRTKDGNGPDGLHAGAGGKVEGGANFFQSETGEFTLNPDGSGYGGKITSTFGELKGSGKAGVEGGYTPKEGGEFSAGAEVGGEFTAAGGKASGEKFWAITVNPDGTCKQSSISLEGGAALGAAAKYNGKYGLDGFESKGSIGLGAYLTGGGAVNYDKTFECSNPFANPGAPSEAAPLASTGSSTLASAEGKSITAIETEVEALEQETEGHAKRAESAAQRAVAAAHRAAAARAQIQAMLSGI